MSTPYRQLKNDLRVRINLSLLMIVTLVALTFSSNLGSLRALASIVTLGVPVTEDFNTLASSGTSSAVPGDWAFSESGTNANTIYSAGTGSSATGDTYSFGTTASADRAFGGLQSGTLIPTIGSSFTNNTGQTITSLDIAYIGEQWRLGATGRQDRLDFQYSLNATSLTTGSWTDVNSLDFIAPITTGTTGALDGNQPANRTNVAASIIGLSIADASTFWIRWTDFNATGADDGLAVDDFSLTANGTSADAAPSVTSTTPANTDTNVALNADITINFSEDVTLDASWYTISCGTSGSHIGVVSGGPQNWTINPNIDFANSETCTVTIDDASVHDVDTNDPPDTMAADYVFSFTTAAAPTGDVIHISQVYGGGGNAGATYTHDFIELFNAGTTTINLTGWSVQFTSAAGSSWNVTALSGSLAPGQYYLTQQIQGAGGTTPLPTPDVIGNANMGATSGKVALVNSTTALTGTCPTVGVVDFVGYGATANCFEGTGPTAAPANTTADLRNNNGCQDTDQNAADFTVGAPTPRNTQSPFYNCTTGDFSPAVSSTTPANGATNIALNADITINFSEGVTLDAGWYTVSCATSGSHTAAVTGGPQNWTLNPDVDFTSNEICTVALTATAVHDIDANDPPDTMAANYVFSFTTEDGGFGICGDNTETLIHTIQGSGLTSPVVGSTPVIEGVVTADYQNSPTEMGGFFIQEEDADADANQATSEGIYVFENAQAVAVGDVVRLQGTVVEFTSGGITFTEISPVATLTVCSGGNSLPAAAPISLPAASVNDLEAYEGMRVTLAQTLYVTEHFTLGRFGEVLLSANDIQYQFTHGNLPSVAGYAAYQNDFARSTITLDDANAQQNKDPIVHPAPGLTALNTLRIGDTVAGLTGILDHRFDLYRIQPTGVVPFTASNPRPAAPDNVGGTIWVGSFNVLNYFSTLDLGPDICGPLANQECRGADSAFEFTRQRDKIIQAIIALNADVIGLMEIENHLTDAALDDLINGLNAIAGAGTYAKISQFPLGDDAIKVALIYRPAWVTPINLPMIDNDVIFDRPPLAQLFEVNNTGERFTVVVNHFKSKGCGGATGADTDQADGQGCYNDRRTQQSAQLLSFINTVIVPGTGDSDVLIIGDLNAYALEDPITTLTGVGMTNLLSSYLGTDTFSYIFDGQAGYLDHALVSGSLVSQVTGVTHWGINGDEPISLDYNDNFKTPGQVVSLYNADPYRSSDHSPVRIGLYPNDFGDLAASYGNAWHTGGGALRLGTAWTADRAFGVNTDDATDDGIERLSGAWTVGATVTLRATVTRTAGADPAWLSCWMDWDGNGAFATPSERAINTAVTVGVNDIPLTVPLSATSLTALTARCRLYDNPTEPFGPLVADPAGAGTGGEVEDYNWGFSPTAITLQEIKVAGNAAAPLLLSMVLMLLVLGSAWGWRRRKQ